MRIGRQYIGKHDSGKRHFLNGSIRLLCWLFFPLSLSCTDVPPEHHNNNPGYSDVQTLANPERGDTFHRSDSIELEDGSEDSWSPMEDIQEEPEDTGSLVEDIVEPPAPLPEKPVLYPTGRTLSPITPFVRAQLLAIASINWDLEADVFMKVGASSTVSTMNMACFSGDHIELGAFEDLEETISFFNAGNALGETPFERDSLAAEVGKTAKWAVTGSPSPMEEEVNALSPLFSLIHYGANDMQMGTTYQSAIWSFGEHLLNLTDGLIDQGIIPMLSTISPRLDLEDAYLWVPTYCAVIRGIAQGRQIPLIDLHYALQNIPDYGLSDDGLHFNTFKENGASRPCDFSEAGLQHGYNVRNLIQCQALKAVKESVLDGLEAQETAHTLRGSGSPESPFLIPSLPFSDIRSTATSPYSFLHEYVGCDATQDESGPEYVYRLDLNTPTHLRALVFDRGEVDIDLHLLDFTGSEEGCLERDHKIIETFLAPGRYHFSLDTFVSGGGISLSGEYLFVLLACEQGDPGCSG
jgi:hypothetical protein